MYRTRLSKVVDRHRWWRHIRIWHLRERRHHRLTRTIPWIRVTHYHPRWQPIHRHHRLHRSRSDRRRHYRRSCQSQPRLLSENRIRGRSLLSSDIIPQSFHFLFLRQDLVLHQKFHFIYPFLLLLIVHHLFLWSVWSDWTSSWPLFVFCKAEGAAKAAYQTAYYSAEDDVDRHGIDGKLQFVLTAKGNTSYACE